MADEKITMPSSTAGITRYFDAYKSKIEFSPGHVIVFGVLILILILLLHQFGKGWFGL